MRDGWGPDSTWIQFTSGPYFAKHDHLDTNHFVIYHTGHLALDSGADYTDTESPHYLNYYRRTVAHNTMLVYQPGERFFWGENLWPAANDGGQRMDSSRFWNSVRSLEDWRRTRDLWDRGRMEVDDSQPGVYTYARGDGTRAYHPSKVDRFVRELVWLPRARVLFVLDRVRSTRPVVPQGVAAARRVTSRRSRARARRRAIGAGRHGCIATRRVVTFEDGAGPAARARDAARGARGHRARRAGLRVLDAGRRARRRVGSGQELAARSAPRADRCPPIPTWHACGGRSGAGLQPPVALEPPRGGPRAAGGWRSTPGERVARRRLPARAGDRRHGRARRCASSACSGHGLAGAVVAGEARGADRHRRASRSARREVTLPDVAEPVRAARGARRRAARYDLQLTSGFAPGSPVWRLRGARRTTRACSSRRGT